MQHFRIAGFSAALLCFGVFGALAAQCGSKKSTTDDLGAPRPPVEATVRAAQSTDRRVTISVTIPAEHHAYLDAGKEGFLIPIAFLWEDLVSAGVLKVAPKAAGQPKGELDSELGAQVLRGPGEFAFGPVDGALVGRTLRIRSQLCNDRTRICYPPSTQKVVFEAGS